MIFNKRNIQLDNIQELFLKYQFAIQFINMREKEFETWFCKIAQAYYDKEFERIYPTGHLGDYKCDGYVKNKQIVFQCYAPHILKVNFLNNKIKRDFEGAKEKWRGYINNWVFVYNNSHNLSGGIPPTSVQLLTKLQEDNKDIKIERWGKHELWKMINKLKLEDITSIFGKMPSQETQNSMTFKDLIPVVKYIEKQESIYDTEYTQSPIKEVSVKKLEKNSLPPFARDLLQEGRKKAYLVQKFFQDTPNIKLGNTLAIKINRAYKSLLDEKTSSSKIFMALKKYCGASTDSLENLGAVLAVMSYFFDRCDIFEDPSETGNIK